MKKLVSLFLAMVIMLSATACTQANESGADRSEGETSAPEYYPIEVTDQAGRRVEIESEPERIVSGYYISTSLLIALELEDKLVGIEAKADKRPIYKLAAPELIELPSVGSAKEFDLEGCIALEPDLVILPLKLKSAAEAMEKLGIDVLLVNPEDQQLLFEMADIISAATQTEERAEKLLGFVRGQESYISEKTADAEKPTVYLAGNSDMLSTAGNGMYQSDMIRIAGGENAAADIEDSYWVDIDYEQLLKWDPDYIILASDAGYTAEDVLSDPNLAGCKAVVNKNVYSIPGKAEAWDSPVPGGILGSLWLANILHPQIFSKVACEAVIDEYYETFYGFTYSEA